MFKGLLICPTNYMLVYCMWPLQNPGQIFPTLTTDAYAVHRLRFLVFLRLQLDTQKYLWSFVVGVQSRECLPKTIQRANSKEQSFPFLKGFLPVPHLWEREREKKKQTRLQTFFPKGTTNRGFPQASSNSSQFNKPTDQTLKSPTESTTTLLLNEREKGHKPETQTH